MAIILIEGWDHTAVASLAIKGWNTSTNATLPTGRFGTGTGTCLHPTGTSHSKSFTGISTIIIGVAIRSNTASENVVFYFRNAATVHVDFRIGTDYSLRLTRNGTTILGPTAANYILNNSWNYYEIKLVISDTVGEATLKVNGTTALSGSSLDTRNGATTTVDNIALTGSNGVTDYDDLYVLDTTGSVNNDFIGEKRVVTLYPTAAGNSTQFTPSTGSNYQNVDDTTDDGDTTYNSSSTAGQIDLFTMGDLPAGAASVSGVQVNVDQRKDDAGSRTIRHKIRISSTNYDGNSLTPTASYVISTQIYETSPATATAWTPSEINGAEFGYELVA